MRCKLVMRRRDPAGSRGAMDRLELRNLLTGQPIQIAVAQQVPLAWAQLPDGLSERRLKLGLISVEQQLGVRGRGNAGNL